MNFYSVFGKFIRPIYIDFVGPFLPFLSYFMLIRSENDLECGTMKTDQLNLINYLALGLFNIGQLILIAIMWISFRNIFTKQIKDYFKNAELKADIAQIDYKNKYGKTVYEIDYVNEQLKAVKQRKQDQKNIELSIENNEQE